jgi:hypothetical protein
MSWAQGNQGADKAKETSARQAQAAELQKLSHQKLFGAYDTAKMDGFASRHSKLLTKDQVLTEIIRRGDIECEEFLKQKFADTRKQKESDEQNLELLTALRRVQKKPDPVMIEVRVSKNLEGTTRNLPTMQVSLKNVDDEKIPVTIAFGGDYRTGRLARWRFQVHDSKGELLPEREWEAGIMGGGGMFQVGGLLYGSVWKAELPMGDFVKITKPGEYSVRILYHDHQTIADLDDINGLILCGSKPFKLKVVKAAPAVIEVATGSRERAAKLIGNLSDDGPIRVVMGNYGPSFHDFIDPKSPEGQLLTMRWDAVPGLIEALRNENLSFRRRGWVLAMLYVIVEERDLNPFSWIKGNGVLSAYEYKGLGCTGSGGGGAEDLKRQRQFADGWLKLQAECWEFREVRR